MSRIIIVREERGTRINPTPRPVIGGPTEEDLCRRAAWMAINCEGEYIFSSEAWQVYREWYNIFKEKLYMDVEDKRIQAENRRAIHTLKVALLMRAQRYERGSIIEIQDLMDAQHILQRTYETSESLINDLGASQYKRWTTRIIKKITEVGALTRTQIMQMMSPYECRGEDIHGIIQELNQRGLIEIHLNGNTVEKPSNIGREKYLWIGGTKE